MIFQILQMKQEELLNSKSFGNTILGAQTVLKNDDFDTTTVYVKAFL